MKRSTKMTCLQRLHDTFGLSGFRPGQYEAVRALLSGRDVLSILPTGAGKSLCWQLPAVVHGGLTVVVSPLIALMHDQVRRLTERGIEAAALDSLMTPEDRNQVMQQLYKGRVRIVFVSPERLMQESFRQLCRKLSPWLLVVDEAHCVVQWGERFRPAYEEISDFVSILPRRPVLCAMTATADAALQQGIRDALCMYRMKLVSLPVIRANLAYDVRTTLHAAGDICRLVKKEPCKTVIFCRTRMRAEQLASMLQQHELHAAYYHAGMSRDERVKVQQAFSDEEIQILCATSAFGMGVDIPGIRRIIHAELPDNVIDYAQQTGRAGRDGQDSACILYIEPQQLVTRGKKAGNREGNLFARWMYHQNKRRALHLLLRIVLSSSCIPAGLAAAFGQKVKACGRCSACMHGSLLKRTPNLPGMKEWQIRAFFLRWQRDALAKQRGCRPGVVASDAALYTAARNLAFPPDLPVPPELERLLRHLRQEQTHDLGHQQIY